MKLQRKHYTKNDIKERASASLFFAPFAILFILFILVPIILSAIFSLTSYSVVQEPIFVGVRNFRYLITEDNFFLTALSNTLAFAALTGAAGYIMSFIFAWVIDNLKFKKFFALMFYAPSITSGIAMSVIWLYFFAPDSMGLFQFHRHADGMDHHPGALDPDAKPDFADGLRGHHLMSMGNGFLAFLAGFQNLSGEISEAGRHRRRT